MKYRQSEAEQKFDRIMTITIHSLDSSSALSCLRLLIWLILIGTPIVVCYTLVALFLRAIDAIIRQYKRMLKEDYRGWIMLRVFIRKTKHQVK